MTTEINEALVKENTLTPNAPNVATTDEIASPDTMFQQASLPSLGRQIFSVLPIHGPTAALFNIRNNTSGVPANANDFELVRAEVICNNSTSIATGVTQEAIQDLRAQYGKETDNIIGKLLRGLANDQENVDTIAFLDLKSLLAPTLTLTTAQNAETNLFEITQRVHELVLQMNSKHLRSYEAFAVLPFKALGGIMALSQYVGADDKSERGLFIAKVGGTKFYMNPVATSTTAYVGLIDSNNPSKSSAVFSPYASNVIEAVNPLNGNNTYHIFNRYAITASPLHAVGEEMLHKFDIA